MTRDFRRSGFGLSRVLIISGYLLVCLVLGFQELPAQADEAELLQVAREHKGDTTEANALNKLYRLNRKKDPQAAIAYLERALLLVEALDYQRGRARVWRSCGDWYTSQGEYDKAIRFLEKSKAVYTSIGHASGAIGCINGLGIVAIRQGNYSLALEHFLAEATHYEDQGDELGAAAAYQNIGGILLSQGQFDKARATIEKALKIKESIGDSTELIPTLNALGNTYSAEGKFQEALAINRRALQISQKYGDPYGTSLVINNIGVQFHLLKQIDSARVYYLQALEMSKELGDRQQVSALFFNLGEVENSLRRCDQAVAYFDSSLAISTAIGALEYESKAYRGLSNAYLYQGDYQQAYIWLGKFHALEDSISGERVKNTIHELEAKYEAGQKDKQIAELERKKAEAASDADRKRVSLTIALSSAIFVVLFFIFFIGRSRTREKQRRAELEQKALRSQMNPHFIFNSLGAIQSMYMSGETDLANEYMGDFGRLMRKILENSGKESISVKEELDMLRLYLGLEEERNSGLIAHEFQIDERIDRLGTFIPPMVIQPFVENAIWHGIIPAKRPGKILIQLDLGPREGLLRCRVEDNGIGMQAAPERSGHVSKGISITEQRLGSKVVFADLSPGTRVTLLIPY